MVDAYSWWTAAEHFAHPEITQTKFFFSSGIKKKQFLTLNVYNLFFIRNCLMDLISMSFIHIHWALNDGMKESLDE